MARLLQTLDRIQTVRQVNHLNIKTPEEVRAHQEDTETDEYCHGVNEWLTHEPAFSGRIVPRRHVAASDTKGSGSETKETVVCPLLAISGSFVWVPRGG